MRVLVGVVDYNPGVKDYALPKLYENLKWAVEPYADILFVSDVPRHPFKTLIYNPQFQNRHMSEDLMYYGREAIRDYAFKYKYDAFVWQGSDCYYAHKYDFKDLVQKAFGSKYLAVGGLTSARTDASFPVARRFIGYGHEQRNIPDDELMSGDVVSCYGFPGADALVIRGKLMSESLHQFPEFKFWYELRDKDPHSLCIEEYWILQMGLKYGDVFAVDTNIRTWHAHEDGIARRWPGQERPISELKFS